MRVGFNIQNVNQPTKPVFGELRMRKIIMMEKIVQRKTYEYKQKPDV